MQELVKAHPGNLWVGLALAENASVAKNEALSRKRYEELLAQHPDDRAVSLSYAEILNAIGTADAGKRAQAVLRPMLSVNGDDPLFQKNFGRASELAGDLPRAGEAFAEAAYLNGRAEDALNQLNALLKRNDIDLHPARPDRGAHRRDHPGGAGHAAREASSRRTCRPTRAAAVRRQSAGTSSRYGHKSFIYLHTVPRR